MIQLSQKGHIVKALNEILGNRTRVEILRAFFRYPGQFTGRHVARLCKLPQANIQRQLSILAANNILDVRRIGTGRAFSLNSENFLYPKLQELFETENELLPKILELIRGAIRRSSYLRTELVHASLHGSMATGEAAAGSDIDLFLVFAKAFDETQLRKKLENADTDIATISGMRLHPYALSFDELPLASKQLIEDVIKTSMTIYGRDLKDLLENETS